MFLQFPLLRLCPSQIPEINFDVLFFNISVYCFASASQAGFQQTANYKTSMICVGHLSCAAYKNDIGTHIMTFSLQLWLCAEQTNSFVIILWFSILVALKKTFMMSTLFANFVLLTASSMLRSRQFTIFCCIINLHIKGSNSSIKMLLNLREISLLFFNFMINPTVSTTYS